MRFGIAKAGSLLVAAVALTSVAGFSAAGAASAASTPSATNACSTNCTDVYSRILGPNTLLNAYVPGDTGSGSKAGQVINMNQGANNRPNEDFIVNAIGTVGSQCRSILNPDGILLSNSVLCSTPARRALTAYEWVYSPSGNQTNLCAGTTGTPYSGLQVRLTTCGTTAGTLVVQVPDVTVGPTTDNTYSSGATSTFSQIPSTTTYDTYISGATNTFSHPYVFTVNTGSSKPENLIQLQQENLLSGSTAASNQLFAYTAGPFS